MTQTKAELINGKGDVTFDTNTLFIDAVNNRVGIGTTSPSAQLHVQSFSGSGVLKVGDVTNTFIAKLQANAGDGSVNLFNESNYALTFGTNNTERARIDSSGRLLVGTSSSYGQLLSPFDPQLQVVAAEPGISIHRNVNDSFDGKLFFSKARGSSYQAVSNNDLLGAIYFNGADGTKTVESVNIRAEVDGTPGANDMPGRLVFSTTADGAASPTERMRIGSTGRIDNISRDAEYGINSATSASAGTTASVLLGAYGSTGFGTGTISFRVWSNGNVVNTNNSYGSISDIKLKENIVDADSQWDDLKALQVRNYNFKEGQTHTQIGLVAQEVELVSPGLVSESPDRDAEGNDLGTVTKSVNYSVLYMKAVKALQEAMERIETLEAAVTALQQS